MKPYKKDRQRTKPLKSKKVSDDKTNKHEELIRKVDEANTRSDEDTRTNKSWGR